VVAAMDAKVTVGAKNKHANHVDTKGNPTNHKKILA
jgi:hypothetical protein